MTRDPEKYLFDILDSSRYLLEFCKGQTVGRYLSDRPFRGSVERELQTIGEAVLQLKTVAPELAERITDSAQIIAFRHVLVHGYFALDPDIVWDVVQNKLAGLVREVETIPAARSDAPTKPGEKQL